MLRLRLEISFCMMRSVVLTPVLVEVLVLVRDSTVGVGVVVSEPLASLLGADVLPGAADAPALGGADSVELTADSLLLVCSASNTTGTNINSLLLSGSNANV